MTLNKNKRHDIDVVVDRLVVPEPGTDETATSRIADSVETALKAGQGVMIVATMDRAGTPRATIDAIAAAVAKAIAKPVVHERLSAMGLTVDVMGPEQLGQRERAYTATWARIIKATGFVPQ